MSLLRFLRPTQIKNLLAPRDSGDAVNYGLIRADYPPITPHFELSGDVFEVNVIEGEAMDVSYDYSASITHPLIGDGVSSFTIGGVFFSHSLPAIEATITVLSATSSRISFTIPALMASLGTQAFQVQYNTTYRANGIDTTEVDRGANNRIMIVPDWYLGVRDSQPTALADLPRIGAAVNGSTTHTVGIPNGVTYIWWPTALLGSALFAPGTMTQARIHTVRIDVNGVYRGEQGYAGDVVVGDHTLLRFDGTTSLPIRNTVVYRG